MDLLDYYERNFYLLGGVMTHYNKNYEEEKLAEAFKNAEVVDCSNNDFSFIEKQLEKQIENNAELYKEVVKLRRWKEQVLNLINEKIEG